MTDGDAGLARRIADDLAGYLVAHRDEFVGESFPSPRPSTRHLKARGRVPARHGRHVGGGSAADGTLIAHEVLRRGEVRTYVCLYDPGSVERAVAAGVGARLTLTWAARRTTGTARPSGPKCGCR